MVGYDPGLISQLTDLGISQQDAIDALKACRNDVAKAADYIFSGDLEKSKTTNNWDEGAFHADRYDTQGTLEPLTGWGSQNTNNTTHFSIQAPDVVNADVVRGPPRTRPSSPMLGIGNDSNQHQDPDIARAIQMSLNENYYDNDNWGQQETGITGAYNTPTQPYFGPAQRTEYDPAQWSMTLSTAKEVFVDPTNPIDRKRKDDQPIFFKPNADQQHFAAALTIFHAIPAAREALLRRGIVSNDYGHNEKWWSGEPIEATKIVHLDADQDIELESSYTEPSEVITEVQRLMAFASNTLRAYGSVDSLAKMVDQDIDGSLTGFIKKWIRDASIYASSDQSGLIQNPFTTNVIHMTPEVETQPFQVLTIRVPEVLSARGNASLYEAMDIPFWHNDLVYCDDIGDVFSICLSKEPSAHANSMNSSNNLVIPADLYLDRYFETYKEYANELKFKREGLAREVEDLEDRERSLTAHTVKKQDGSIVVLKPIELLEANIGQYEVVKKVTERRAGDVSEHMTVEALDDTISKLRSTLEKTKQRIEELNTLKTNANNSLAELVKALTGPETTPEGLPPMRKHELRGVYTELSTFYVKTQAQSNSTAPNEDTTEKEDQWWMVFFPQSSESGGAKFKLQKCSEKDVLDAAKYSTAEEVLLVYASANAMKEQLDSGPLPQPLQDFVQRDNEAFLLELEAYTDKGKRKRQQLQQQQQGLRPSSSTPNINIVPHDTDMDYNSFRPPPGSPAEMDRPVSPTSSTGRPQKKSLTPQAASERFAFSNTSATSTQAAGSNGIVGWNGLPVDDEQPPLYEETFGSGGGFVAADEIQTERYYGGNVVAKGYSEPFHDEKAEGTGKRVISALDDVDYDMPDYGPSPGVVDSTPLEDMPDRGQSPSNHTSR